MAKKPEDQAKIDQMQIEQDALLDDALGPPTTDEYKRLALEIAVLREEKITIRNDLKIMTCERDHHRCASDDQKARIEKLEFELENTKGMLFSHKTSDAKSRKQARRDLQRCELICQGLIGYIQGTQASLDVDALETLKPSNKFTNRAD